MDLRSRSESEGYRREARECLKDARLLEIARDVEVQGEAGVSWERDAELWSSCALYERAFLGPRTPQRERAAQLAGW